jgi:hypothetical protein
MRRLRASQYVVRWPFYVFVVLRQTLQAHHRVLPIGITVVVANLVASVELPLDLQFGFPAMGVNRLGRRP